MKFKTTLFSLLAASAFLFVGCYPDDDLYYSDTDVAVTNYDTEFSFTNTLTYTIVDTVMHIVGENDDPPTEKGRYDDLIMEEVVKQMQGTMFVEANLDDTINGIYPDLVLTISVMETNHYSYYYYPWYGYWGWYSGWGWGYKSGSLKSTDNTNYYYPWYPWYPTGGYTYSYSTGTIMLDLHDENGEVEEEKGRPVAWIGRINGILSGQKADTESRIKNQVEQVFVQSPYLHK